MPVKNKKRVNTSGRSRKFFLVTYLSEIQLQFVLLQRTVSQIRSYAYCRHDKDVTKDENGNEIPVEPHTHLVIVTYNACTLSAVRRWFHGYKDEEGKEITTTGQICTDIYHAYDYLIHDLPDCRDKFQYPPESRIVQDSENLFKADERVEWDNIQLAAEMLYKGANPRDLACKFGRDFILHYNQIKSYLYDVMCFEKNDDINTISDLFDYEERENIKGVFDKWN